MFSGIFKPLCYYGVLGVIFLVYAYLMWRLNDEQIKIEDFYTFLVGHREVVFDTRDKLLGEIGTVVCT